MEVKELRYLVEHKVLPANLFEDANTFIGTIVTEKNEFIASVYKIIAESVEVQNPYSQEDFEVNMYKVSDDCYMVQIIMPKPEIIPQCYKVYIIFGDEFKNVRYFTIEMGEADSHFLCSWDKEECHSNFGTILPDEKSEIDKILSIY